MHPFGRLAISFCLVSDPDLFERLYECQLHREVFNILQRERGGGEKHQDSSIKESYEGDKTSRKKIIWENSGYV